MRNLIKFQCPDWLIFGTGTLLRVVRLGIPLHGDEAFSYLWYCRRPFADIVSDYSSPNNHIFHSFLMHTCYLIFGPWEPGLRLPVFIAGIAGMYLTWWLALILFKDQMIARWSLAFMAFSGYMVQYSTEGRGYMIAIALGLGAILLIFEEVK